MFTYLGGETAGVGGGRNTLFSFLDSAIVLV